MIKGQCLCKGISYEYNGVINELAVCHCYQCKKAQGTAFVTNAPIKSEAFRIVKGRELMTSYYSSPNKKRVFCSACGSPLYSQRTDMTDIIRLRVGTIIEGRIPKPSYQAYCESKSAWMVFDDKLPMYLQGKE